MCNKFYLIEYISKINDCDWRIKHYNRIFRIHHPSVHIFYMSSIAKVNIFSVVHCLKNMSHMQRREEV